MWITTLPHLSLPFDIPVWYISIYGTGRAVYNLVRALPQLICVLVCRSRFGTRDNSYLSFRLGRRLGRNRNGSSLNIRNCEVSRACPWVRLFLLCQIYLLSEQVGGSSAVFLCMRASEPRIMPYPTGDGRRAPAILPWAHGPVSWGLPWNHGNADPCASASWFSVHCNTVKLMIAQPLVFTWAGPEIRQMQNLYWKKKKKST